MTALQSVESHTPVSNPTLMAAPSYSSRKQDQVATAIQVKDVTFDVTSGGQSLQILKGINWEVPQGTIQLLMGPSGSGKTTLLSILAGLLSPADGSVSLLGTDITRLSATKLSQYRLKHIGFIFQDFNLFPALTARDNVELKLNLLGIRGRAARQQAECLLEQVGLADKMLLHPRYLSGGQQQRVAIARALAGNPPLIMADEPTASLDSTNGRLVMELLRNLARQHKATVLMVTHDPRIVDLADRIATMEDGLLRVQTTGFRSSYDLDLELPPC
jgi:putative ABC transport system ATP-binding protein